MQTEKIEEIANSILSELKLKFPKFSKDLIFERNDWHEHIIHYKHIPAYYLSIKYFAGEDVFSYNYNRAVIHFILLFTNLKLLNTVCKLKRKAKNGSIN